MLCVCSLARLSVCTPRHVCRSPSSLSALLAPVVSACERRESLSLAPFEHLALNTALALGLWYRRYAGAVGSQGLRILTAWFGMQEVSGVVGLLSHRGDGSATRVWGAPRSFIRVCVCRC